MTNLREAVARAICFAAGFDPDHPSFEGKPEWTYYAPEADAAIAAVLEAMGEPSEGMLEAGAFVTNGLLSDDTDRDIWSAMLAAFRGETLQDVEGRK